MGNGGFDATMGPASTSTTGGGGTVVAGANIIVTSGSTVAVANSPTISVVTTTAPAVFNGGTHIPASFPTATALEVTSDSGAVAAAIDTFGGVPRLISRRANGTPAAPSGVILNDTLFSTMSFGYGASAYSTGGRALFNVIATENWSNTAQGAAQTFQVTANGGTVTTEALRINHNGDILIGSTADAGTGKLQVTGTAAIDVLTLGTTAPFSGIGTGLAISGGLLVNTGTGGVTPPTYRQLSSWVGAVATNGGPLTGVLATTGANPLVVSDLIVPYVTLVNAGVYVGFVSTVAANLLVTVQGTSTLTATGVVGSDMIFAFTPAITLAANTQYAIGSCLINQGVSATPRNVVSTAGGSISQAPGFVPTITGFQSLTTTIAIGTSLTSTGANSFSCSIAYTGSAI